MSHCDPGLLRIFYEDREIADSPVTKLRPLQRVSQNPVSGMVECVGRTERVPMSFATIGPSHTHVARNQTESALFMDTRVTREE